LCPLMSHKNAIVLPWLFIGDKKCARDRQWLRSLNIRYVVNTTPPRTEGGVTNFFEKDSDLEYLRVPLRDLQSEALAPRLPPAMAFLERARIREDGAVLVHCNEGKSRSCAVICAYLIQTHGLQLEQALRAVRRARPQAMPNDAFLAQLTKLDKHSTVGDEAAAAAAAAAEAEEEAPELPPSTAAAVGTWPSPAASKRPRSDETEAELGLEGKRLPMCPLERPSVGPSVGPSAASDLDSTARVDGSTIGPSARPSIGPRVGPCADPKGNA